MITVPIHKKILAPTITNNMGTEILVDNPSLVFLLFWSIDTVGAVVMVVMVQIGHGLLSGQIWQLEHTVTPSEQNVIVDMNDVTLGTFVAIKEGFTVGVQTGSLDGETVGVVVGISVGDDVGS